MPIVNLSVEQDLDSKKIYVIDTLESVNVNELKDEIKELNNVFTLYKNKEVIDYDENLNTSLVDDVFLGSLLDTISTKVYYSIDKEEDKVDEKKLLNYYKNLYQKNFKSLFKEVLNQYEIYNDKNPNNEKQITKDEVKEFVKKYDSFMIKAFSSYVNLKLPVLGGMDNKEYSLFFENAFNFRIRKHQEHKEIKGINEKTREKRVKEASKRAHACLIEKPNLIENKKNSLIIKKTNDTINQDCLLNLRYEYKEIENIHKTRPLHNKFMHIISYIKEKRYMSNIISKANKLYKNTKLESSVKDIIKGDENNINLNTTFFKLREERTSYLDIVLDTFFGNKEINKYGFEIFGRDYSEALKYDKELVSNRKEIKVNELKNTESKLDNVSSNFITKNFELNIDEPKFEMKYSI